MDALNIISYNVKGLHNPVKRKKILHQLKRLNCHIAFLQETHLSDTEHEKLRKSWADKIYYSSHRSGRKRGVSILIHRQINFTQTLLQRDTEGRYILVNGLIDGIQVSLINVYAPNEDDPSFITTLFTAILKHSSGLLLMGGDFNCVLSQLLDRQPASKAPVSRMGRILKYHSIEAGLVDVWRSKFPRTRNFTFYSSRHISYSRIDLFFTPKVELHRIRDIEILPITISDHAPVLLKWDIGHRPTSKQWRLNASLLNDKTFTSFITAELGSYLDINTLPETTPLILWDCAKAYIRGRIISFTTARKKERDAKRHELENKIKELEHKHKQSASTSLTKDLNAARRELNSLLTDKIEGSLRFTNQRYYEYGNRASRLLAFRLRKQQSSNTVQRIKSQDTYVTRPDKIAKSFAEFYKSLYKNTDTCSDDVEIQEFLNHIKLTELSEASAKELDEPIEEWEIKQVISTLKNNKSPGPDGYVNEFYKTFKDLLSPLLLNAYHYALQSKTMAPSWAEATIVVIHKEGKDPTECQSYRPISLLNADLRILTAILARRVNQKITQIIHPDQTGFITGRYYGDNLRRLLNIISYQKDQKSESMILSLDAQKAFDRVSWQYLFLTLKRFKFGPNFINWIQTLYSSPQAAIKVNGYRSERFTLERGCRQGCSLSPLLFAISIEPFAQLIRDSDNMKGIVIDKEEHKISLYADDVLLFLTKPTSTIPHLKELISKFGHYSGYKVNVEKTEAMEISGGIPEGTKLQSGFKWSKDGIKYLGIYIPPLLHNLYETNYGKMIRSITSDLERWSVLPLSLIGRVESVRMNILPRLLYLFQMLPVEIPQSTFDKLDKLITHFIWQKKRPRIRLKTLQLSKLDGGLGLPNLKYYFWAAQLKPLKVWIQNDTQTRWLNIEQSICPEPMQILPFLDTPIKELTDWTKITLKIWKKIQSAFGLPKTISSLASIGFMKTFTPNNLDTAFRKWSDHGLVYVWQLFNGGNLKTFEQLKNDFELPRTDFFRYLQLRTFLTTHKEWTKLTAPTPIEEFLIELQTGNGDKKIVSKLYHIFLSMNSHNSLRIKQRWEAEMNMPISQDTWRQMCTEAHLTTNSNTWKEFKWKIITRYFRTPEIVAKMGPPHSSSCWRNCGAQIATHTHIFWSCPKLRDYWREVFDALEVIFQQNILREPTVALLGMTPEGLEGRAKKYLLNILLTAALKSITIRWLKPDPPTYNIWIQKVWDLYHMEQITYTLRLQRSLFVVRWTPVMPLLLQ